MSKTFVESTVLRKPHLIISNLAVLTGFSLKHRKFHHIFVDIRPGGGGGGGGTPIYGLYRYVPRNRVWFLRFSVLK